MALNSINDKVGKNSLFSSFVTVLVLAVLLFVGPVSAVTLLLSSDKTVMQPGDQVEFSGSIDLSSPERLNLENMIFFVTESDGTVIDFCSMDSDAFFISCNASKFFVKVDFGSFDPLSLVPGYTPGYVPGYTPGYTPGYFPGYTPGYTPDGYGEDRIIYYSIRWNSSKDLDVPQIEGFMRVLTSDEGGNISTFESPKVPVDVDLAIGGSGRKTILLRTNASNSTPELLPLKVGGAGGNYTGLFGDEEEKNESSSDEETGGAGGNYTEIFEVEESDDLGALAEVTADTEEEQVPGFGGFITANTPTFWGIILGLALVLIVLFFVLKRK